MALTPKQKKLLATQGYFHGAYGNKVGHENMKGSEDDPIIRYLSLKKNHNLPNRPIQSRMSENVNQKTSAKYLPTAKYVIHERKRLNV